MPERIRHAQRGRRATTSRFRVEPAPTDARHKWPDITTSAELLDRLSSDEASGRAADPWEVAVTIAFLASDYSCYRTEEVDLVSTAPVS